MAGIAERLRKAREIKVEAGGFTFLARRPTDLEMMDMRGTVQGVALLRFLIGWEGVKESDVIGHGDPHPLDYAPDVAVEWLSDRPDLFGALAGGIFDAYAAHSKALEDAGKNLRPGSTNTTTSSPSQAALPDDQSLLSAPGT